MAEGIEAAGQSLGGKLARLVSNMNLVTLNFPAAMNERRLILGKDALALSLSRSSSSPDCIFTTSWLLICHSIPRGKTSHCALLGHAKMGTVISPPERRRRRVLGA